MPSSFRQKATIIVLLALVLRCALAVAVEKGFVTLEGNPDSMDYLSFAHNLSAGIGFAHSIEEGQPFSQQIEFSAWRPPLFPAMIAVVFKLSRNILLLRLVQAVLSTLALCLFLRLGFILFGEVRASIAGLFFALYPPLVLYSIEITTEALFIFLLLAFLLTSYQEGTQYSAKRAAMLGILAGLSALCRPNGILLAPALVLMVWVTAGKWQAALRTTAIVMLTLAFVVLPWTYRNYRLFQKPVLLTTIGGVTLWAGAHLHLVEGAKLADVGIAQHKALRDIPEPNREQHYYREAFTILRGEPTRFMKMLLSNFSSMYALVPSAKYHNLRNRIIYSITYIPILLLGLAGSITCWRRWRELSLLWGTVLGNTLLYCVFLGSVRYRVAAIDPILILGAGICVGNLLTRDNTLKLGPSQ